jgi:hypothetical protein
MAPYPPPIGLEIPCSSYAPNTSLWVSGLGVLTVDFKGGWRVRVEENISSGLGGVRLRVIGNEWSADSDALGRITFSQTDIDTTPLSLLEVIKDSNPPVFRNTMFLDWKITFERAPISAGPLVLANTKTAALIKNDLRNFPPQGEVYELQEPVDLARDDGTIQATLQKYSLTVSHNP